MPRDPYEVLRSEEAVCLFHSAEELWFWFIHANEARQEGALCRQGISEKPRPCEPNDIMQILNRVHRNRQLMIDHFRILSHYGNRGYAPDGRRPRESKAHTLWREAFRVLGPIFENKGFMRPRLRAV